MPDTSDPEAFLSDRTATFMHELSELLAIPSISTDPEHRADVRRAAAWTAQRLRDAGIEGVTVAETGGHPVVVGEWLHAPGRPTLLFYGHFDVQPPDPLALWTTPPFQPAVREGCLFARGASDMKANLLMPVEACEAWLRSRGALPVNVKFLYEGEEEIGSPSLGPFAAAHQDLLACDVAISADSGQAGPEQPALLVGLRGLAGLQIDVRSARTDLHSGLMGGLVPNAAQVVAQIVASLKRPDGRILVEGFYDDVTELSPAERDTLRALPDDSEAVLEATGAKSLAGEPGFSPRERNWARPTLDVNGIWGGFQGEGVKTVIPAEAHAKVTCRLVPAQRPDRIVDLLSQHVRREAPAEVDVVLTRLAGAADPYLLPPDHAGLAAAERALKAIYGREPLRVRMGASVPATAILRRELDVWTVPFGFSLTDERAHAPDEFIRLASIEKGRRAFVRLLGEF